MSDFLVDAAASCLGLGLSYALFTGDDTRPSSIASFGLTGGAERWLKIPLDLSQHPVTFALQAELSR